MKGNGCADKLANHGHHIIDMVWWDFLPVCIPDNFFRDSYVLPNFSLSITFFVVFLGFFFFFCFLMALIRRFWFGSLLYIFFSFLIIYIILSK